MNRSLVAVGVCLVFVSLSVVRPAATQSSQPTPSPISHIENRAVKAALHRTLPVATRKLASPRCASVLTEFKDASGRPLADVLAAMHETGPLYLGLIVFVDGHGRSSCSPSRTLAVTVRGSRVVFLCPQFAVVPEFGDGDRANVLIHEALHSLGLGEDPPSAREITAVIEQRCGK